MTQEEINTNNAKIARFMDEAYGLQYHSDWSWLMPVVAKISSLEKPDDPQETFRHFNRILSLGIDSKIETVYAAVIRFINWHNKQGAGK
jgi:hypothetical protein